MRSTISKCRALRGRTTVPSVRATSAGVLPGRTLCIHPPAGTRCMSKAVFDKTEMGLVVGAAGEMITLKGLAHATPFSLVTFSNGSVGLVSDMRTDGSIRCSIVSGSAPGITDTALVETHPLQATVSDVWIGRVVDALGRPVDSCADFADADTHAERIPLIATQVPPVVDRRPATECLATGIKAFDVSRPLLCGSSNLLRGEAGVGKSALALDVLLNITKLNHERCASMVSQELQAGETGGSAPDLSPVFCVYVIIGASPAAIQSRVSQLRQAGALEYTSVVVAPEGTPSGSQYIAPFTGAAIGEFHMRRGRKCFLVIDNLTNHFQAARTVSGVDWLRTDATPTNHGALFDRCAQLNEGLGGGSLTMLALVHDIPAGPKFTQIEHIKTRHLVAHIASLADNVMSLSKIAQKATAFVPIDLHDLVPMKVHAAQGHMFQYYANRFQQLLIEIRNAARSAMAAKEVGIELEADAGRVMMPCHTYEFADELLQLHSKTRLLFLPTRQLLKAAEEEGDIVTEGLHGIAADDFEPLASARAAPVTPVPNTRHIPSEDELWAKLQEDDDDEDRPVPAHKGTRSAFRPPSGARTKPAPVVDLSKEDGAAKCVPFDTPVPFADFNKDPLVQAVNAAKKRAADTAHADAARSFLTMFLLTHGYVQRVPSHRLIEYEKEIYQLLTCTPATAEAAVTPSTGSITQQVQSRGFSVPDGAVDMDVTGATGALHYSSEFRKSILYEVLHSSPPSEEQWNAWYDIKAALDTSTRSLAEHMLHAPRPKRKLPSRVIADAQPAPKRSALIDQWTSWLVPMGPKPSAQPPLPEIQPVEVKSVPVPVQTASDDHLKGLRGHLHLDLGTEFDTLPRPLQAMHVLVAEFTRTFCKEPKF